MEMPQLTITSDNHKAQQILVDLNSKLTDQEKDHPGTAWYLSQLNKIVTNNKEK